MRVTCGKGIFFLSDVSLINMNRRLEYYSGKFITLYVQIIYIFFFNIHSNFNLKNLIYLNLLYNVL